MFKRVWYLGIAIFTFGIVKAEEKTVFARRTALIDRKVRDLAKANDNLGELGGTVKTAAREVEALATKVSKSPEDVELSKVHSKAVEHLTVMAAEYDKCRDLILKAEKGIRAAKERGEHLERQFTFTKIRLQASKISHSMSSLGCIADELSAIDETILREMDKLEGHIKVVEDLNV